MNAGDTASWSSFSTADTPAWRTGLSSDCSQPPAWPASVCPCRVPTEKRSNFAGCEAPLDAGIGSCRQSADQLLDTSNTFSPFCSPFPSPPSHYAGHWVVQSVTPIYWPHITHLGWAFIGAGFGAHYYDGPTVSTIVRRTEGSLSVLGPWSGHIGVCRNECLPTRNP